MANGLYTTFLSALMNKQLDLDTDQINVALLDSGYSVNLTVQDHYSAYCAAHQIQTGILSNNTITSGVFNADNYEFPNVTHGSNAKYIVVYHDTTDQLIAYFDTDSNGAIDLPCVGNDIHTEWNASGIFAFANCP